MEKLNKNIKSQLKSNTKSILKQKEFQKVIKSNLKRIETITNISKAYIPKPFQTFLKPF